MKYYILKDLNDNTKYKVEKRTSGAGSLGEWPEDKDPQAAKYLDESLDIEAAHSTWLGEQAAKVTEEEKAGRIKKEFDICDELVGLEAANCFGTTNIDAMNADKDTIMEIRKGEGYLVGAGFKARRDLPEESIVKGQVLISQADLERYAEAMWQRILAYGQKRVQLMADRDNRVEAIEAEY